MEVLYTYKLSIEERCQIISFLALFENFGIEQHPDYLPIIYANKKICYFICKNENTIIAYTAIIEKNKAAFIYFGPLIGKTDFENIVIKEIIHYYKKKLFAFLEIIPPFKKDYNDFYKKENIERIIKCDHNWATILIDLSDDLKNVHNKFSEHHKRQLKKSLRENLVVKETRDLYQIENLAEIYIQMYNRREIKTYLYDVNEVFRNLFNWILKDNGFCIGVFKEESMIGGIIVLFAGDTAYYQFGATNAEYRNLPILHTAFYKAFELSKSLNKKYFDLGGYVINAKGEEQVFNINRFKRGFGGKVEQFSETVRFKLNPFTYWQYQWKKKLYSLYKKFL